MSHLAVRRVLEKSTTKGAARLVLIVIAEHTNGDAAFAWPGYEKIAREANIAKRSVERIIPKLGKTSELYILPGRGKANNHRYIVTVGLNRDEIVERLKARKDLLETDDLGAIADEILARLPTSTVPVADTVSVSPKEKLPTSTVAVADIDDKVADISSHFADTVSAEPLEPEENQKEPEVVTDKPSVPQKKKSAPKAPKAKSNNDELKEALAILIYGTTKIVRRRWPLLQAALTGNKKNGVPGIIEKTKVFGIDFDEELLKRFGIWWWLSWRGKDGEFPSSPPVVVNAWEHFLIAYSKNRDWFDNLEKLYPDWWKMITDSGSDFRAKVMAKKDYAKPKRKEPKTCQRCKENGGFIEIMKDGIVYMAPCGHEEVEK